MASVVGGGSVINGMFADRGSKADYDAWETLGNQGWGWNGLIPYFRKSSTFTPQTPELVEKYGYENDVSGYGDGPLQIGYPSVDFPDMKNMSAALKAHKVATSKSPEGGDALGFLWVPSTLDVRTGTRSHARAAYYDTVATRSNLHLITGHTVDEIIFDEHLTATGVHVISRQDNTTQSIYALKEVIMAAGAISTPKLLQLSGVGSADVLKAARVGVKLDLPAVGANFQDHPVIFMSFNESNLAFPTTSSLSTSASVRNVSCSHPP
jgi:choline dehydrogenase-like flavoprotein